MAMGDPGRDIRKVLFGEGRSLKNAAAGEQQFEGTARQGTHSRAIVEAEIVISRSAIESEMHHLRLKELKRLVDVLETDRWLYDCSREV